MKKVKGIIIDRFKNLGRMKLKTVILLLVFISIGYLMLVCSLYAAVPQRINYQGKLLNSAGEPVSDGNRNITFRIFNVSSGGGALWSETQSVNTQDGLFNVILGSVSSINLDFNQDYWLEVQVSGDGAMSPRHRLVSVPYSFRAEDANNSEQLNSQSAGYYLDASNINAGTLNDARLSANVTRLGSTIDTSEITTNIVSSVDGVSNDGGNIDLVAGSNITITPNDVANNITISANTSGDNLGNHTATQNLRLNGHFLSGDGGNEGIYVTNDGIVGIGTTNPLNCVIAAYNNSDKWLTLKSTNECTDDFNIAINGIASGSGGSLNFGVWGIASATNGTNYGIFGNASNGTTNWAGYFNEGNVRIENNLGIGETVNPTHPLHMGSGAYCSAAGVWTNASSRKYKENIRELTKEEAISVLRQLKPVEFNYKVDKDDKYIGFISEDVPELVAAKDRKGLSSMDIVGVLTKATQEQQIIIEELRKEISLLKEGMKQLEEK